jgi:hypothetical protein
MFDEKSEQIKKMGYFMSENGAKKKSTLNPYYEISTDLPGKENNTNKIKLGNKSFLWKEIVQEAEKKMKSEPKEVVERKKEINLDTIYEKAENLIDIRDLIDLKVEDLDQDLLDELIQDNLNKQVLIRELLIKTVFNSDEDKFANKSFDDLMSEAMAQEIKKIKKRMRRGNVIYSPDEL